MLLAVWPLCVLSLLTPNASFEADETEEPEEFCGPPPVFHELTVETDRTMVGDWESPHTLLLVATSLWPETMSSFLDRALEYVDVLLLADETVSSEPEANFPGPWHSTSLLTHPMPNTPWIRDYGPIQVRDATGEVVWLDAQYSSERVGDDDIPTTLGQRLGKSVEALEVPLDGGALASNGEGLCVSTVEFFLEYGIGVEPELLEPWMNDTGCEWLVLVNGLVFDETRHVDMFMQFTDANTVVVAEFDPRHTRDYDRMESAVAQLREASRTIGLDLAIDRVAMPRRGKRYYPYLNMLQFESAVLVPDYPVIDADEQDRIYSQIAMSTGKQVVPVMVEHMVELSGALHCAAIGLVD